MFICDIFSRKKSIWSYAIELKRFSQVSCFHLISHVIISFTLITKFIKHSSLNPLNFKNIFVQKIILKQKHEDTLEFHKFCNFFLLFFMHFLCQLRIIFFSLQVSIQLCGVVNWHVNIQNSIAFERFFEPSVNLLVLVETF